ncbi:uncharacterized protein C1orf159 homolog isoform 1-T1 [Salvelinus alpinus]
MLLIVQQLSSVERKLVLCDLQRTVLNMAVSYLMVLSAALILISRETPVTKALHQNPFDCCGERQRLNSSCSNGTQCEPGCYLRVLENNTAVCMHCDSTIADLENFTACNYTYITDRTNRTNITTVLPTIGGPGVAASLLFGTLLISLFLILSVASFFYLKRSNRLPGIFYRRNKAYIFQPNETAVMIPSATSSGKNISLKHFTTFDRVFGRGFTEKNVSVWQLRNIIIFKRFT